MEDTITKSPGNDGEISLKFKVNELEAQILEMRVRHDELQKENSTLKRENSQLKRMPLFVAVVVDILDSGEVYLRQQGNNQEYLTHVSDELLRELKPGVKVAVNNALSIVKIVGNIFDARVRVMETRRVPDYHLRPDRRPRERDRGGARSGGVSPHQAVDLRAYRGRAAEGHPALRSAGYGQDPDRKSGRA